jgi:histidyl-tRNA synthetase
MAAAQPRENTSPVSSGFQSIRGMHDILPREILLWQRLERVAASVFARYGYEEIRVPLLEKTEVFTRAIGEATDVVEKEMYTFPDRNGESLSLRPEGTAGVVRAALQNGLLYGPPVRLWYGGPMFRYERPQKGRTRQFHQLGAELFGAAGPDVDAELIRMGNRIWSELGLTGVRLEINSLGTTPERQAYRQELVAFLGQHADKLDEATRDRVERNPLRVLDSKDPSVQELLDDAPRLGDFLGDGSRRHFDGVCELLTGLGVAFEVNQKLVRGLDYYCHTVFEWITGDLGAQGTICAGGRYDGLVELQGGKPWPGIGFAMGEERLVELLRLKDNTGPAAPHAYMVMLGSGTRSTGMAMAESLRDALPRLRILSHAGGGSFRSQFKKADRSGAELALVLGEDELAEGNVEIKRLREDLPQETVPRTQLEQWLRDWLESRN